MPPPYTGGCRCGAVRYEFKSEPLTFDTCHCTDCRITSASAFGISVWAKAEDFTLTGQPHSSQLIGESGRTKTSLFCADCATRVCSQPAPGNPVVVIRGGTLDEPNDFPPIAHTWTKSALT